MLYLFIYMSRPFPAEAGIIAEHAGQPKKVDVIASKDTIIPLLTKLIRVEEDAFGKHSRDWTEDKSPLAMVRKAAKESLIPQIWGELSVIEGNLQSNEITGVEVSDIRALEGSKSAKVTGAVVVGTFALHEANQAQVKDSLIMGVHPLSGLNAFSNLTREQILALSETVDGIFVGDEDKTRSGLSSYDRQISEQDRVSLQERVSGSKYRRLIQQYGDLAVAAFQVNNILAYLPYGASNIRVENSVVYGPHALNGVNDGEINNSIIVTAHPSFSDSNLHIVNSYIVSFRGVEYIEDKYTGSPVLRDLAPQIAEIRQKMDEVRGRNLKTI